MLIWLRRALRTPEQQDRQDFIDSLESMNREALGGTPTEVCRRIGTLALPSGALVMNDPQEMPNTAGNRFVGLAAREAEITVTLWQYPSGYEKTVALQLQFGDFPAETSRREIGSLGIDSAKIVVAAAEDLERHWTEIGPDRIGKITTARDDTVKRLLTKRFGLKTRQVSDITAEVVGPVSEALETEIVAYLKTIPQYADFPIIYFRVQTNNSFDRVNYFDGPYGLLPIGNEPTPVLLTCGTGHGDGRYTIYGAFSGERLCRIEVDFLEDSD